MNTKYQTYQIMNLYLVMIDLYYYLVLSRKLFNTLYPRKKHECNYIEMSFGDILWFHCFVMSINGFTVL